MFQSIHFNAKPRAVTNASKPEVLKKLKEGGRRGKYFSRAEIGNL
jgi:hypothetical protein